MVALVVLAVLVVAVAVLVLVVFVVVVFVLVAFAPAAHAMGGVHDNNNIYTSEIFLLPFLEQKNMMSFV